ncbi:MAG TPA: GNAT family N-acetyltransferase [Bacteroidales bacterium]|nr:GNAT family N-acetyltransferase [Bacteroidales bacterium]
MELTFRKIGSADGLEPIKDLYLSAFPAHERRTFEGFRQQVEGMEGCAVNVIATPETVVGFFILWDFENFGFIEHMAIEARYRGQKLGQKVLHNIAKGCNKPIILEVEPPIDEDSRRRISFYIRNGFQLLDIPYVQPSYDGVHPGTEMRLMTNNNALSESQLSQFISQIHYAVYGQRDDPDVKPAHCSN